MRIRISELEYEYAIAIANDLPEPDFLLGAECIYRGGLL